MKASPRQQRLLLDLQALDNSLARLKKRRVQLPQRAELAGMQGELTAAKEVFMAAQRELDTQNADIERLESDIDVVRQRIQRDNELSAASQSAKEAQALQTELETLARRQSALEDRELELMEANELSQSVYDAASAALASVDQRRADIQNAIAEAEAAIDRELAETTRDRAGLAAELQRDLLEHYETLRARIGIGAARLRGKISEASNMELAPAELTDILAVAPDELVHCPQSGAILVRVEDDAA
ncbi:hypothetical protein QBL02_12085 [Leucobacter sp. UT-8R-CII-1-4]|uniref:zinc ribbon domain-containing protein n=1 Tax=Leucobacter sp. UT-8R-CII-1-4 TaxID=3040075 RepID=UPI0024A9E0F0|nr:hypothetical protein [Leucobacter sp. UT-8R-CII-1-4]MDI6024280.1 hypothetical protein [Leucobacter sp. UT-8R-CII-1-4]